MKARTTESFFKSLKKIDSPVEMISEVRSWIKYHFNRDFFKRLKTVLRSYPWDEHYLYELEKAKIHEMCKYHEKRRTFVGSNYTIRDMKICIRLIDIFNHDGDDLYHYTGEIKYNPIEGTDNIELDPSDLVYHCDIYVNTKNADRFLSKEQQKYWHPHEIYLEKARRLYHKIRVERDFEWWD